MTDWTVESTSSRDDFITIRQAQWDALLKAVDELHRDYRRNAELVLGALRRIRDHSDSDRHRLVRLESVIQAQEEFLADLDRAKFADIISRLGSEQEDDSA